MSLLTYMEISACSVSLKANRREIRLSKGKEEICFSVKQSGDPSDEIADFREVITAYLRAIDKNHE